MLLALSLEPALRKQFNELINGVSQRNKHKNRTYYFFNDIINIEDFDWNLPKIDKNRTKTLILTILDTLQLKKLVIREIFTVQILYIW